MGHTNSTPNIGLPQFIGTDKPTWLGDVNGAMSAIDTKVGSIDAAIATTDAKADNAVADAAGAVTTATNAVTTAGNASTTATQANNLATQALTVANNTADLCTNQIVPDVAANTAAIGTLADLTTTAKDNIVDAINEVAQGGGGGGVGAWTLIDTKTETTPVSISGLTYTEYYVTVDYSNRYYYCGSLPAVILDSTERQFFNGAYSDASHNFDCSLKASSSAIQILGLTLNGASVTTGCTLKVYGR